MHANAHTLSYTHACTQALLEGSGRGDDKAVAKAEENELQSLLFYNQQKRCVCVRVCVRVRVCVQSLVFYD